MAQRKKKKRRRRRRFMGETGLPKAQFTRTRTYNLGWHERKARTEAAIQAREDEKETRKLEKLLEETN